MEKRGLLGLLILAILAMTIGITASATASASAGAVATKKKCKKPHSAKKRCTKKKRRKADAPDPNLPVVRATLSWFSPGASDVDLDLYVFDGNGNRAGNGSDAIPLSSLSGDVSGSAGSETFTDSLFALQAARDLSFGVCYFGSVSTNFTITYVTADGVVHGDSQSPVRSHQYDYPGGAPIPNNFCNFA